MTHSLSLPAGSSRFRDFLRAVQYALALGSAVLFAAGYGGEDLQPLYLGMLGLFFSNVIYGFFTPRRHVLFLLFHGMLFTFLLCRPLMLLIQGAEGMYYFIWLTFPPDAQRFPLTALFLTLLFLRLGAMLAARADQSASDAPPPLAQREQRSEFLCVLQRTSLLIFLAALACQALLSRETLLFMRDHEYADFYVDFHSRYPFYVHTLAAMLKYALCLYLATMPRKRAAFFPLSLYLLSAVPSLLVGMRNPIVLAALFILVYYLLRDILGDGERWMGRLERGAVLVLLPVAILLLSLYNYVRSGLTHTSKLWVLFLNFFYGQGVSYDVLCRGYMAIPNLPDAIPKNYTFGPFIDYILHGTVAQKLFGAVDLGTQNSELLAVYGHSFSHSMSYVAHPEYLEGHGWGSSYLLEVFADWGYWGVVLFSLLLGFALVWCFRLLRRGVLLRTVTLTALTGVFYIPRDSAMGWLQFLVTLQFWLAVGGACAGAAILLWLRRRLQRKGRDPLGFLTRPLLAKYRWFVPRQPQKQ